MSSYLNIMFIVKLCEMLPIDYAQEKVSTMLSDYVKLKVVYIAILM